MREGDPPDAATGLSRLAAWSIGLWLVGVTGFYVWTAVGTLRRPFNPGSDTRWAIGTILFLGASAAFFALFSRRRGAGVWVLIPLAVALAILVLSGQLTSAILAAWVLALAWSLGDWVLRRIGANPSAIALEWACIALPLGLAFLSLVGLALAGLHVLTREWVWAALGALTVSQLPRLRRAAAGVPWRTIPLRIADARPTLERGFLYSLIGFVALINLAWAVAPEIHYDSLNYHLAVPKLHLSHGGLVDLPYFWHSYFVQLVEMLFTLSLALRGQIVAKLLILSIGLVVALQVHALGRRISSPRAALWATALFYSTPIVSWLSTTTYVELAISMFLVAALIAFLRWREERRVGWICATGFLAGAAIAAKSSAVLGLPVVLVVMLRDVFRRRDFRFTLKHAGAFALAASIAVIPWFAARYALTGNPVYPFLDELFEGSRPVPSGFSLRALGEGFGTGNSARALIELPFRFTFDTDRFGEALPDGGAGFGLLLFFPVGLWILSRRRAPISLLVAVCAVYLMLWATLSQYARFVVPVLPLVAALAAANVDHVFPGRRLAGFVLSVGFAAQVVVIPVQFWNIPERIPLRLAFGDESEEEFLSRSLRAYPATRLLNDVVEPGERILGVGVDNVRFYLDAPLASPVETWELSPILAEASRRRVAGELTKRRYAYLVVDTLNPTSRLPLSVLNPKFLAGYATAVYRRSGVEVYRLRPPPASRAP